MRFGLLVACCALGASVASLAQPVSSDQPASPAVTPVSLQASATPSDTTITTGSLDNTAPQEKAEPATASAPADTPAATPSGIKPDDTPEQLAVAPHSADEPATPAAEPESRTEQHAAIPADNSAEPVEAPTATEPQKKPAAETASKPEACAGHPNALGTSRVLTISPDQFKLLGTLQYKETLPLEDHEVVLTFDDGPIPPYTNSVLDTLASQCVKATYFLVGDMARARPYLVRRIYNEGHSIGTHSQHHPYAFQRLSMQRVESEVDGGIESVKAALGDPKALSPFFRIPGFGRTSAIDHFLEQKNLVTWSTDIDTNDWWRGSSAKSIVQRAMRRLEEKGRGIILMHDIHPATALALPALLKELKAGGYRVVHVVAAGDHPKSLPEIVASPAEKENWPRTLNASDEDKSAAKSSLRHRVKTALGKRQKHRTARRKGTLKTSAVESR